MAVGLPLLLLLAARGSIVTIDVQQRYGDVDFVSVGKAMRAAKHALVAGDSATVKFGPGVHHIDMPASLFNVTRLAAAPGERLTIAGAGMLATTLNLTTRGNDVLTGRDGTSRLTVRDLTFARPAATTTQGSLVSVTKTSLAYRTEPGFPQLGDLFVDRIPRLSPEQGLFVKRYRRTANGVQIVANASCRLSPQECPWPAKLNSQLTFLCGGDGETCPNITSPSPDVWHLELARGGRNTFSNDPAEFQRYRKDLENPDAVLGVKVKHGGQAFRILNGHDILWESVRWLGHSRGVMQNCEDVALRNTLVEHEPSREHTEALATPGGGPQVNGCNNLTIVNHTSVGTGDDALGLKSIESGYVRGCHIRDSFARAILLCNVSDSFAKMVYEGGNVVERCPILRKTTDTRSSACGEQYE